MHIFKSLPVTQVAGIYFFIGLISAIFAASVCLAAGEYGRTQYQKMGDKVNEKTLYPTITSDKPLHCTIELAKSAGHIDGRIFGTNLEWFNDGGGIVTNNTAVRKKIHAYAGQQGATVMRYPGGTLADYYDWRDGIGPVNSRPKRQHPTDSGRSFNHFGSPEYFQFLKDTRAEGLITVNVGTAKPKLAADWVAYANQARHPLRLRDGFSSPIGIKLWEIGNELYLPGNPHEKKITQTPAQYAAHYLAFSRAMKKVDPSIQTIAIGLAKSHQGPDSPFQNWTKILLEKAAKEIDMIAVHNAYFPVLYTERQPNVRDVYPALMASPEAVNDSLITLEKLLTQYESDKKIGIAITEWGSIFSLPNMDNYWVDHVKTMGSGVYVARMLQVFMNHPRVKLANHFKLTDRTFMGTLNYNGEPKVPYWVFALYANHHGDQRLNATLPSPTFDTPAMGIMKPQKGVAEVTVIASENTKTHQIYINFVNRSLTTTYPIQLHFKNGRVHKVGKILSIKAKELTAHNGRDIPPEWQYDEKYEPYTTATPNSIKINTVKWNDKQPLKIAPFSVMTLVLDKQQ